ncbi:PREDICTED: 28S ribosomal protein S14, mitochondrial [Chaetura pelagica]|uniref:28S ribosomal protein S14, mitochondrial n=1 Tax=Chaetura pelagica TaxID=8897 RepID=UPI000523963F|nr:PREDICTED: 28S ribosomal protein S14, mitochondrial [Chaetura pelagica]
MREAPYQTVKQSHEEAEKLLVEVADKEIASLPRDSCPSRIHNRCILTSRPRGVKRRWRLSRIVFRHFADHAEMSGIQRAMW